VTYDPVDLVEVRAWDRTVGAVLRDPATGYFAFQYDEDWVRDGTELAPLRMRRSSEVFVFPELDERTFHRLPALLADALPDRFGNALVNAWMLEQGVRETEITALDRLAYAADRAMGALTFHPPADRVTSSATAIQLADLVTAARATVAGDLEAASEDALRELILVGTSAGGARAKAVIAFNPSTGQVRSGQLEAPEGFEHWLVKLDGVNTDPTREDDDFFTAGKGYGKVEYAYHRMALACGVDMTECRLLPEGPRTHFLTRRFDRDGVHGRRHVQTLCAIDHLDFNLAGAHSYAQYLDVIDRLGIDASGKEQAFRRIVFNVAGVNRDDHTKNLSFVMDEDGSWDLSPAYDVTHSHRVDGGWTMTHQMTVLDKREGITVADLSELGERWKVPAIREVIGDVLAAVDRWPEFAEEAGVDPLHQERIAADLAEHRPR
jgi:serine/threonine-protein kinase HipA